MPKERVPTEAITRARLASWERRLAEEHATPAVLVGIGHDEAAGTVVVVAPEDLPDGYVVRMLEGALVMLRMGLRVVRKGPFQANGGR